MAFMSIMSFKEAGPTFAMADYEGYLKLKDPNIFDHYSTEVEIIAGMILTDDTDIPTLDAFFTFCLMTMPSIIMLDYHNIVPDTYDGSENFEKPEILKRVEEYWYDKRILPIYEDLYSYEFRYAFGLKWEFRKYRLKID